MEFLSGHYFNNLLLLKLLENDVYLYQITKKAKEKVKKVV